MKKKSANVNIHGEENVITNINTQGAVTHLIQHLLGAAFVRVPCTETGGGSGGEFAGDDSGGTVVNTGRKICLTSE